jgi:hypothetical protein
LPIWRAWWLWLSTNAAQPTLVPQGLPIFAEEVAGEAFGKAFKSLNTVKKSEYMAFLKRKLGGIVGLQSGYARRSQSGQTAWREDEAEKAAKEHSAVAAAVQVEDGMTCSTSKFKMN